MVLRKGRLTKELNEEVRRFTSSLENDLFLAPYDIRQSIAHTHALEKAGVISASDSKKLVSGLKKIKIKIEKNPAFLSSGADDIHMAIEEKLGKIGEKLHAGRSRNDQVACDMRMYVRDSASELEAEIEKLQRAIKVADISAGGEKALIPVYTHMQRAQAVTLSTHLGVYRAWLQRDRQRLAQLRQRANRLPLGSGASAGTGIKLDLEMIASELGFEGIIENPIDAVSSRDYIQEFSCVISIFAIHLSRMAEDLIIFSTSEFDFITLSEEISETSSIMPQKKNPDCLELVRSASSRLCGISSGLMTLMKGLPLSYNRDMQDDKQIYPASRLACTLARVVATVIKNVEFNTGSMEKAAREGFTDAADFAEYLTLKKGVDFRQAHRLTGLLVLDGIKKGYRAIAHFSINEIKKAVPEADEDLYDFMRPENAVQRRLGKKKEESNE